MFDPRVTHYSSIKSFFSSCRFHACPTRLFRRTTISSVHHHFRGPAAAWRYIFHVFSTDTPPLEPTTCKRYRELRPNTDGGPSLVRVSGRDLLCVYTIIITIERSDFRWRRQIFNNISLRRLAVNPRWKNTSYNTCTTYRCGVGVI